MFPAERQPMMHPFPFLLLVFMVSCSAKQDAHPKAHEPQRHAASAPLGAAYPALAAADFDKVLTLLEESFTSGYPAPSELLADPAFRPLRDDPQWRPQLRDLLSRFARESSIRMVDSTEQGPPLALTIRILDEQTGAPLSDVHVKIVQVDHLGLYAPNDLDQALVSWNPRLFGFCTTNAGGFVHVRTIRPAHYHPHYDAIEPAHLHFTVNKEGYREWGGEIFFDDDPRVDGAVRRESRHVGTPILQTVLDEQGVLQGSVSLHLQRP